MATAPCHVGLPHAIMTSAAFAAQQACAHLQPCWQVCCRRKTVVRPAASFDSQGTNCRPKGQQVG